ncbi:MULTISPECIES: hypothetical protein [Pseudomonas]|uniref:Inclusion body protein n=1 Tax=Pseudomonas fitomaticsae TaxID=2837969 RepID=A0ABY3QBE1_9PSED|nr:MULTISPECIES: hypothetical protein [Pseudomonas]UFQ02749.1 hypothetical protein KJY40_14000 [Pseudomonas fitomaticsae]UVM29968.1 hypothetical protein LOY31_13150 [Pseudomonas sp. B21-021]
MNQAIQEKTATLLQQPAVAFTLFDQNGVQITLNLPSALQINQNGQEYYPPNPTPGEGAPVLHNNTIFPIESATFTVELLDVIDASSNVIANVRWWNNKIFDGKKSMEFTVKKVLPGEVGICVPSEAGYNQVRWATSVSSGRGTETFKNTLNIVTLTFGPLQPNGPGGNPTGPIVQIG